MFFRYFTEGRRKVVEFLNLQRLSSILMCNNNRLRNGTFVFRLNTDLITARFYVGDRNIKKRICYFFYLFNPFEMFKIIIKINVNVLVFIIRQQIFGEFYLKMESKLIDVWKHSIRKDGYLSDTSSWYKIKFFIPQKIYLLMLWLEIYHACLNGRWVFAGIF